MSAKKTAYPQGVTLFEILVAVALLGLLLILGIGTWRFQLAKARDAERKSKLQEFKIALIQYHQDKGCFPEPDTISCDATTLAPYIDRIPCDPINSGKYVFLYTRQDCNTFAIYNTLEYYPDPIITKLDCQDGCGPSDDLNSGENVYNYYVTSSNTIDPHISNPEQEYGVTPTCGSDTKYCFPNLCGTCCPGEDYRCNSAGSLCILDAICSQ